MLNFLPDDYVKRRRAHRANVVCIFLAAGGLLIVVAAVGATMFRAFAIAGARAAVEEQHHKASLRIRDLEHLEKRKADLLHKAELSAALLERVPRSHILARLTNSLPADTSLTSLSMQREKVHVPLPQIAAANTADAKIGKRKGKKTAAPATLVEERIRFRLDGLAQTDVQVAEYISRLSNDPVFEGVDLQFSEDFPFDEGVTMRRFQLSFLLSKNAVKTLEAYPKEAAAQPQPTSSAASPTGKEPS
jgi:Tfp pilus assembly protein PilN